MGFHRLGLIHREENERENGSAVLMTSPIAWSERGNVQP